MLTCDSCHDTCRTCKDSAEEDGCTGCWGTFTKPARYLLKEKDASTGKCSLTCPPDFGMRTWAGICDPEGCRTSKNFPHFQNAKGYCQVCPQNCRLCFLDKTANKVVCEKCNNPYVLLENQCKNTNCLTSLVPSFANDGICTPCDKNCKTCVGAADRCLSCFKGTTLDLVTYKCVGMC